MVEKIIWSNTAIKDFDAIINYLSEEFESTTVYTFYSQLLKKLNLIQTHPELYPLTSKRNTCKAVVNKRLIIFYQYKPRKKEIAIISLWDTCRNK
ncbi:MAG: type II toxin-antitoxin system RelE/ParE family toxin [Bacteroidota bacterium]|nr:type II toxin-antitoxin system RelE/ParE family toxin [Bacteroidota bacterium]